MTLHPHVVAVVPLKWNNKRLPGKNAFCLGSLSLYNIILNKLCEIDAIDDIYVYSSDFSEFKSTPISSNVKLIQRPPRLDDDNTNFDHIFTSFINAVHADVYVYAHATSPFISVESIKACLSAVTVERFSSSFTAQIEKDFFWMDGKPLTWDKESSLPRSQDLKPLIRETSGIYVIQKDHYLNHRQRVTPCSKPILVAEHEGIDINTPFDWLVAQAFYYAQDHR